MFGGTAVGWRGLSQPLASHELSSKGEDESDDVFELAAEYGAEAAPRVAKILVELDGAGFAKARGNEWSAFDRILSGISWLLHRLVPREDAERGRVQWDVLHQSHVKMRPRLGFAQEVVRRIEALPFGGCPVPIQPHQLLLQDFGDIGTVHRVVSWLIDQAHNPVHLSAIRQDRKYLQVHDPEQIKQRNQGSAPLTKDVAYLMHAFGPRRRWQYVAGDDDDDSEDALIQRCLFEYGERVAAVTTVDEDKPEDAGDQVQTANTGDKFDLMAQIASQVAARAAGATSADTKKAVRRESSAKLMNNLRMVDPQAADFDKQYQRAQKQALLEQQKLVARQREREAQLLQQVVSLPDDPTLYQIDGRDSPQQMERALLRELQADVQAHEVQVHNLIREKNGLDELSQATSIQADELNEAMTKVQTELTAVNAEIELHPNAQPYEGRLRRLIEKNEKLKLDKESFRAQCRVELDKLQQTIVQLKQQATDGAGNHDEEAVRLQEIEHKHAEMRARYMEMKRAVASQSREVQLKMKQIDEIPTRIELIQYEKRFVELYDEVALTLEETRKYFCVYNTLKTTHEFLEKEISLINSIHENFDVAMGSKVATQAFFSQIDTIVHNIQGTLAKQRSLRDGHQGELETLDSKYQLLLDRERLYVNSVREFQKECEKNDRLSSRMQQAPTQAQAAS